MSAIDTFLRIENRVVTIINARCVAFVVVWWLGVWVSVCHVGVFCRNG